ncbi:MAG: hypothetical protein K8T20_13745 [Planctomycetes bacterium]|nr:hypothetical protein [Planctomycetota bacterium]
MAPTALVIICTGEDYWKYLAPALDSARRFFPADVLLFTDHPSTQDVARQVHVPHEGWPAVTLMRFHTMLKERSWLSAHEHIFYLDIDMRVVGPIGDEIFSQGITACLHVAFMGRKGTPEVDPRSTACVSLQDIRQYFTGCFYGGESKSFLEMAEELRESIDVDNSQGFIARWHDESHLNRFLHDHPPAKILGEPYNAWTQRADTRILRIDKGTLDRPAVGGKQPYDARNAGTQSGPSGSVAKPR